LKKGLDPDPDLDPYIKYTDPQHWFRIRYTALMASRVLGTVPGNPQQREVLYLYPVLGGIHADLGHDTVKKSFKFCEINFLCRI